MSAANVTLKEEEASGAVLSSFFCLRTPKNVDVVAYEFSHNYESVQNMLIFLKIIKVCLNSQVVCKSFWQPYVC